MGATRHTTDGVTRHEIRIAASPETVFSHFTDPARMVRWMGAEATLDPRPGGVCRIDPSGHGAMLGAFVEIDPPRRVVFTWGWERELFSTPPQSTLVEVTLTSEGEETVLRLQHSRLRDEAVAVHRAGWEHYLPRLAIAAPDGDPGADSWRSFSALMQDLRDASAPS